MSDDVREDLAPDELFVQIAAGPDFQPSERLKSALENLSEALAEEFEPEDADEVAGFSTMAFDSMADPLGLCFKFGGSGGCSKVRCPRLSSCELSTGGGGSGGGSSGDDGGDTIPIRPGIPGV
jgi:hypothetical protein